MAASRADAGTLRTLEIGRFAAAAMVVLTHLFGTVPHYAAAPTFLSEVAPPGALAVQFFFVLSGFVMAVAHGGDRGRDWRVAPRFLWRRACRIYPMYWLALALAIAAVGLPRGWHAAALLSLWPHGTAEYVPPAWTLRYEVGFYLVLALVLLPRVGHGVALVWLAGTAVNCFVPFECRVHGLATPWPVAALSAPVAGTVFSGVNFLFFAGLAAGLLHRQGAWPARTAAALALAGTLVVCGCLPWLAWGHDAGQTPFLPPIVGAGFGAALLGLAGLERARILRPGRWALRCGAMSYPLYILHAAVVLLVTIPLRGWRLSGGGVYALAIALLLTVLAVSAAAAFGVDQPVQRLLRRRTWPAGRPTAFDRPAEEERG